MTATGFPRSDALPGDCALGYVEIDGEWRTNVFHLPVVASGDGGAYTTTADLARFWAAFMAGRIVGPHAVRDMLTPRSEPAPGDTETYGLGLFLDSETPVAEMHGADAGVSFFSAHHPWTRTTVTTIANTSQGAWPVARLLFAELA
jgi:CubicO group peptidase (beta-lactamase class C family)